MLKTEHTFFFAKTISELFYQLKSVSGLQIVGGCTRIETVPDKAISIRGIQDLAVITKHERYLDCGPGVVLSDILTLGRSRVPDIFLDAVQSVANPIVRNIATIGGNICAPGIKLSLYASLLALDTHLELRSPVETLYVPLPNFTGVPQGFILSNIRIPLNDWDISVFRRLGPEHKITDTSASFAFLADNDKRMITNIKLAFAGPVTFRSLELENRLIGTHLPLSSKDISFLVDTAGKQFDKSAEEINYNPILRRQFLNLTRYSLEQLT
ncbi:MAG: FAD binding domain-containing protein [Treponema sp.]|nr:FAD binding domain-containing protein [Treponema sp.]